LRCESKGRKISYALEQAQLEPITTDRNNTMAWPTGHGCVEMKTGGKLCIEEGTACW